MRAGFFAGLVGVAFLAAVQPAAAQSVLGPSEHIDDLEADPAGVYAFIVRGDAPGIAAATILAAADPDLGPPTPLPLIDGVVLALHASDAIALSTRTGIQQVWYVPRLLVGTYAHVIQSFQYIAANSAPPEPINLSLGPDPAVMPIAPHLEEPMNEATRRMADKGFIPVMAVGNYYDPAHPNPGVVNPWCLPDWVICVGAAHPDLSGPWVGSARGTPGDPSTWPDVVANGVDVLGPWTSATPKSMEQRQHDEASTVFRTKIPKQDWNSFTLMSGTSQATAQVTRAVSQITFFVQQTIRAHPDSKTGEPLFSIVIPPDRYAMASRIKRLTGDVGKPSASGVEVSYRWVDPWVLVKQLLIDTVVPMKGSQPSEVGAGYVSPDYIDQQFGQYGIAHPVIMPVKAIP
jgi:subtilisin family serine protease